jgi:GTP pyrophosphokinase
MSRAAAACRFTAPVIGEDRRGFYADLMQAVSRTGTNIRSAELQSRDGIAYGGVLVEVEHQSHLQRVIKAMRRVKGVTDVDRREPSPLAPPR